MAEESGREPPESHAARAEDPSLTARASSRGESLPRRSFLRSALSTIGASTIGGVIGEKIGYSRGSADTEKEKRMPFVAALSEPPPISEREITNSGEFTYLGPGEIVRTPCKADEPELLTEKEANVRFLSAQPLSEIVKEIREPYQEDDQPKTAIISSTPEEGELSQVYKIRIPKESTETGIYIALPEGANVHVAPVGPDPKEITMQILEIAEMKGMKVLSMKTPTSIKNSSVYLIVNTQAPSTPQPDTVTV